MKVNAQIIYLEAIYMFMYLCDGERGIMFTRARNSGVNKPNVFIRRAGKSFQNYSLNHNTYETRIMKHLCTKGRICIINVSQQFGVNFSLLVTTNIKC